MLKHIVIVDQIYIALTVQIMILDTVLFIHLNLVIRLEVLFGQILNLKILFIKLMVLSSYNVIFFLEFLL